MKLSFFPLFFSGDPGVAASIIIKSEVWHLSHKGHSALLFLNGFKIAAMKWVEYFVFLLAACKSHREDCSSSLLCSGNRKLLFLFWKEGIWFESLNWDLQNLHREYTGKSQAAVLRKKQLPVCSVCSFLVDGANVKLTGEGRVYSELRSLFLNGRVGFAFKSKVARVLNGTMKAPE